MQSEFGVGMKKSRVTPPKSEWLAGSGHAGSLMPPDQTSAEGL